MKVLHVITEMQRAAGTSVFCGEIANQLVRHGHESRILVASLSEDVYPVDVSVSLTISLRDIEAWGPNIVHLHALWSPWLYRIYRWAKARRLSVVWSPHGMLTSWALSQKRLKKAVALALYQKRGLRGADLLHVTAPSETEDVRRLGLKNLIAEVPLGVDVPTRLPIHRPDSVRTALFVSRVHPKKGLFDLVEAWAALRPAGWQMVVAGPSWQDHGTQVEARARAAGLSEAEFRLVGPVYGEAKTRLYAQADLFVLPTYSENFGSVVIEALAQGCPVLTTTGAPWEGLVEQGCGWWIEPGVAPLTAALRGILTQPPQVLQTMGERGYVWVRESFGWESVGRRMAEAYRMLL